MWQLPQNLLGLGLLLLFGYKDSFDYQKAMVYSVNWMKSGVSLGKYIILHNPDSLSICHEYGHCRQSRLLGPFYLIAVGLWSGLRAGFNLYKPGEYYKYYPENWADELGGIYWDEDGVRRVKI